MKLILENWKRFLKEEQTRTLYHGTLRDNLESIKEFGIVSDIGDGSFVDEYYDENDEEKYVFFSDKHTLNKALTAMRFHISKKLNKSFHDINEDDIKRHGLLVISKNVDVEYSYANPENREEWQEFRGVEPEDYFFDSMQGDIFLTGNKLISFLRNKNLIPFEGFGETTKSAKERLIKIALKRHMDIDRQKVINKIQNLEDAEVRRFLRYYQG